MPNPEIKQIADYIKDLEHDLCESDYHDNAPALDVTNANPNTLSGYFTT